MKEYTIKRFTKIGQMLTYYYDFKNDKWISEKDVRDEFEFAFSYDERMIKPFLAKLKSQFRPGHNDLRLYCQSI